MQYSFGEYLTRCIVVKNKRGVRPVGAFWCVCVCLRVFVFVGVRWRVFLFFFMFVCSRVCFSSFSTRILQGFLQNESFKRILCTYAPAEWESERVRTVHLLQFVLPFTCVVLAFVHIQLLHTMN